MASTQARVDDGAWTDGLRRLENQRVALRDKLDRPLGGGQSRADRSARVLRALERKAHKLDLTVSAMRAQLVATERYYEQTRKDQPIRIHCISLGDPGNSTAMQTVAAMSNGTFKKLGEGVTTFEEVVRVTSL